MVTAKQVIQDIDAIFENDVPLNLKLRWISDVNSSVYSTLVDDTKAYDINTVQGQREYNLPVGVLFEDILKLSVNGQEYTKSSAMDHWDGTFCKNGNALRLDPIPDKDIAAGIEIIVRDVPPEITKDNENDVLPLPRQFKQLYYYNVQAQLLVVLKDQEQAENYGLLYNQLLDEFQDWYFRSQLRSGK